MRGNFSACVDFTLLPGNDGQLFHVTPGDAGGATAWGITRATLSRWLRRPASVDDVRALTKVSVQPIYQGFYWNTINGDALPLGVDLMVFDHGVLSGEHESAMELQLALGFTGDEDVDGFIGPMTLAATGKAMPVQLIAAIAERQEAHYRACATFPQFGNGWLARLGRRKAAALQLLGRNS